MADKYFTCVGASHGAPAIPATRKEWEESRNISWLPDLCRRIQLTTDDEKLKKLKSKLPVWTPRCAEFRNSHRKESEALKPLNRLMLDIDEKGHTDEIMNKCRSFGSEMYLDCDRHITLRVLLIEDSVRFGTHILVEMPEGLSANEIQELASKALGFQCDPAVKNVAGCIYQVPMTFTRFIDEALFTVTGTTTDNSQQTTDIAAPCNPETPCHSEPAAKNLTEQVVDTSITSQERSFAVAQDDKGSTQDDIKEELCYQGIPYSAIIQKYWELYNNNKLPSAGNRNVLTYELAMNLRTICDYDQDILEKIIPQYDGFSEEEWRKTIANAVKEPRKGMPYRMKEVLKALHKDRQYVATGGTPTTPPSIPEKLPQPLKLLTSKVPSYYVPAVCEGVFPALGAHLHGVKFIYTDNVMHEATFMNVLMAPMSSGKSCIKKPIDYIMQDIKERDEPNRQREAQYKQKNPSGKAKKEPRPTDICIQMVIDNMTDAVFNQRVVDAHNNGERFLYSRVDEIEQLKKVTSKGSIDEVGILMRKAWDNADHGQERVGADSVTGIAPLRWNFNASSTIQNGCKFLFRSCNDGTLSRLNISTIIKPEDDSLPVYGIYDDEFAKELKPYIDRLNMASGLVECPEALTLAHQITEENAIRASQYESEAYRELSYRANVIAYLKGMVLFIMNDYQWSDEIAEYVRWSEQMDLWCKMRFFGNQLETQMGEEQDRIQDQPQNIFAQLPQTFNKQEYLAMRQKLGKKGEGMDTIRQWKKRGLVYFDEIDNAWHKLK